MFCVFRDGRLRLWRANVIYGHAQLFVDKISYAQRSESVLG